MKTKKVSSVLHTISIILSIVEVALSAYVVFTLLKNKES